MRTLTSAIAGGRTCMWTNYNNGSRDFCGHKPSISDGFKQHKKLPENLVTPATKDDELISGVEVVGSGRVTQPQRDLCEKKKLELFACDQEEATKRGFILIDTKYEFGLDEATAHDREKPPENIDKELLRLWLKERCDPYNDAVLPEALKKLVSELPRRCILLYELITGSTFKFAAADFKPDDEGLCALELDRP
ncbi:hypothetical protein PF005_g2964 [Phytophthora fragariae]|uniref:phosphoribosylaminoimidazolesuccinocarboxamide synthase n=1 Tax=Phytophthora fragariae TaxID=53985 RepID=A0A6A4AGK1_9STRA|nr:hypothetical protein PF003_g14464 [Phytophthora fragariae]KAE8946898.1 hypothetical protein PF009_g3482 [Phytophthora fragariae]KAE9026228.1 hypothetical protein PF011_g2654 [Phytophthora fragariae]KAE9133929.1 hypothetical protein PF010_g2623 [Phytophthora fragariae]KAE9134275.1 hypothetical protein PF007_g2985 [Phytophthora fragariae]